MANTLIKAIISLIIFSCSIIADAQEDISFFPINMSSGLSSNKVNSICTDSHGYVWIATSNGLNRFDGNRIRQYYADFDTQNIPTNNFWNVKEDGNGVIWVGIDYTNYILYFSKEDRFDKNYIVYLEKLGLKRKLINPTVQLDDNGNLWIWDSKGLEHYYFKNKAWVHYDMFNVERIYVRGERVYILQNDLTIKITSFDAKSIITDKSLKQQAKNFNGKRAKLFVDDRNGIWAYNRMHNLLYYKKEGDSKWRNFADDPDCPKLDIRDIALTNGGWVVMAMGHQSLCYYDHTTEKIMVADRKQTNLPEGSITRVVSCSNLFAVGFEHNGIALAIYPDKGIGTSYLSKKELTPISKIKSTSMALDNRGNLWLGSDGEGIYILDLKTHKITNKKLKDRLNVVVKLYCDKKNRIWVCTFNDGVYIYDNVMILHFI